MKNTIRLDLEEGSQIFFEVGDITEQSTDAIVNAANSSLMGGSGVDGAIHRAGGPAILEECRKIVAHDGHLPPGEAVQTTGGQLRAAFVIHTVGPVWRDGMQGESGVLANTYRNSLRLADRLGLHSLAFPAISTGVYGYPVEAAAAVAVCTVVDELANTRTVHEAHFVLFSPEMFSVFIQAAKDEQKRRKATGWNFATIAINSNIPTRNTRGNYEPQKDHCRQLEDVQDPRAVAPVHGRVRAPGGRTHPRRNRNLPALRGYRSRCGKG